VLFAQDGVQIVGAKEKAYNFKERHAADPPSAEQVETWIAEVLVLMLAFPSMVRRGNRKAAWFYERIYILELLKLLYHLEGVEYGVGYKHIDKWMAEPVLELVPPFHGIWQFFHCIFMALEQLAGQTGAEYPQKFVSSCWKQFRMDMDQPLS